MKMNTANKSEGVILDECGPSRKISDGDLSEVWEQARILEQIVNLVANIWLSGFSSAGQLLLFLGRLKDLAMLGLNFYIHLELSHIHMVIVLALSTSS